MLELLLTPEVFKALATFTSVLIVAFLAWKWKGEPLVTYFRIVFQVWGFVNEVSVVTKWKGYEKLAIAMEELQERFFAEFGKVPSAKEEGLAVRIFNFLCKFENKKDVEDFFETSEEEGS